MAKTPSGEGQPIGPRGGTTTVTKRGMVRKNLWMPEHLCEALRLKAFTERQTETAIICAALALYLGVEEVRNEEGSA